MDAQAVSSIRLCSPLNTDIIQDFDSLSRSKTCELQFSFQKIHFPHSVLLLCEDNFV